MQWLSGSALAGIGAALVAGVSSLPWEMPPGTKKPPSCGRSVWSCSV